MKKMTLTTLTLGAFFLLPTLLTSSTSLASGKLMAPPRIDPCKVNPDGDPCKKQMEETKKGDQK